MYDYTPLYYSGPTQVRFYDGMDFVGGIAYHDYIICGCCGGVIDIDEVYEFAPDEITNPIIWFENWVDIQDEIAGDAWPENPFDDYPSDEEMCEMEAYYFANLKDESLDEVD